MLAIYHIYFIWWSRRYIYAGIRSPRKL